MVFAPEYVHYVLNENFEDAKALFLSPLMAIHYAHLVMLADTGIVSRADAHRMREALDAVSLDEVRDVPVTTAPARTCSSTSSGCSIEACGEDVAGRLHTARSRNDIDMTMYRMRQREFILGAGRRRARRCARALLDLADRSTATRSSPRTRTRSRRSRRRSRTTCSAVIEQLERDADAAAARPTRRRTAIRSARARSPAPGFRSIAR